MTDQTTTNMEKGSTKAIADIYLLEGEGVEDVHICVVVCMSRVLVGRVGMTGVCMCVCVRS
jgi:hypothetical protein